MYFIYIRYYYIYTSLKHVKLFQGRTKLLLLARLPNQLDYGLQEIHDHVNQWTRGFATSGKLIQRQFVGSTWPGHKRTLLLLCCSCANPNPASSWMFVGCWFVLLDSSCVLSMSVFQLSGKHAPPLPKMRNAVQRRDSPSAVNNLDFCRHVCNVFPKAACVRMKEMSP